MADARTFTKIIDGRAAVQVTSSPAEAVRLKFAGWREQKPASPQPEASPAGEDAEPPAKEDKPSDTSRKPVRTAPETKSSK
jgi:hypothetical protein